MSCAGLEPLGIVLDDAKNNARPDGVMSIHADESPVKILVIPTNEELEIALQTVAVLA